MRQYGDGFDLGIVLQIPQKLFEGVTRIIGAVAVILIGKYIARRRPSEQDWRDVRPGARIVQDLREPVDSVLETVVEAVHEDQSLPLVRAAEEARERGGRLIPGDDLRLEGDEIRLRIAGRLLGPLNLADLAVRIRRDRDDHVGERRLRRPSAAEQKGGRLGA